MKGGITSGVVYPLAVCKLAETYRFKNVGGTSAGAIAAAATAAAEYGRGKGGFEQLADLPAWIGADKNLQGLFQPQGSTRRLFAVLIGALEGGALKACLVAVRSYWLAFLLGVAPGAALFVLALAHGLGGSFDALAIVGIAAGVVLALTGAGAGIVGRMTRQVTRAIPDNKFGLCSGGPGSSSRGTAALTPWLTDLLNEIAALPKGGGPLTFGHLWAGPGKDREDQPDDPDDRFLELAMMTTNLVNRRAHQLPWERRDWFFDPVEFRELFPAEVVDWMEAHPPVPRRGDTDEHVRKTRIRWALMRPLLPLPVFGDLPVVVATRMSLSFPVLLSAVPLWGIDMSRKDNEVLDRWRDWAAAQNDSWDPLAGDEADWPAEGQPTTRPEAERCWFSDGGISSNFPVHFFDRLIPRWPTFAINLRPFPPGETRDDADQSKNTWMVRDNNEGIRDWWYRLPGKPGGLGFLDSRLFAFLSSMMRTMQNRADEAQMRAPGYRDRIAHVSMSDDEGGMNLTMAPETIAALTARGMAAAELLREAYTLPDPPGEAITWDNHRWVRLRSSLAVLEQMHQHFTDGYATDPETAGERSYVQLVDRDSGTAPVSYEWVDRAQHDLAAREIDAIMLATGARASGGSVLSKAPRPEPVGRITPQD